MGHPFRVIVSEVGTWQKCLGSYLLEGLRQLPINDPFLVRNSTEVDQFLKESSINRAQAFSVDIKDLYYSLPQDGLFAVVQEGIETIGEVRFQNAVGTSVANFLDLLQVYLRSTVIQHNEEFYVQKNGICIGSRIAPIMSDLWLAHYDRLLQEQLSTIPVKKVSRYVDDFLVILSAHPNEATTLVDQVFEKFKCIYRGLTFTRELPEKGQIRFLASS
ncbi:uncharacterized protein LOC142586392 [Dermacentor variabilis]|uniref:uncharacterized protein LOC142586392 n=1 Tax=Dermacentor variabilis TaxID=34621 RepID=UPI003F5B77E9